VKRAALVLAFLTTMCAAVPTPKPIPTIDHLSLDEKIGQLFSVPARGVFMSESSPSYQKLVHHVRDNHVGGFIWFLSNVYETALLNQRLQDASRVPLLISADLEAGVGMRFADTTFWPSAMAIAATGEPGLAEEEGRVAAREARALGVNHILAPVADVNVDPDNPVINVRSFGEDPADVSRYVAAFVRGVQGEHVLATAKHFPGHGDTHVDSHRSLPMLDVTRERLGRVELVPFRAAIEAGVGSIMVGHLAVPSVDPTLAPPRALADEDRPYGTPESEIAKNGTMPATTSPKIVGELLRRDLHYDGLVVTDAFDMGGITERFDPGEGAVRAIEAGVDEVLMSTDTDAAIAAVKAAIKSGRLTVGRIDESVRRILAAKQFAGAPVAHPDEIFRVIDSQEHRELAGRIARKALTLVREEPAVLPLKRETRVVLVNVSDFPELANPLPDFERELRRHLQSSLQVTTIDSRSLQAEAEGVVRAGEGADVVVVALAVRARSGAGRLAVPDVARAMIGRIGKPVIVISFGSPYALREIPNVKTYLCAYGIQPVMQMAAVAALFGETEITGRLPVTIPGLHSRGEGIRR